MSRNNKLFLFTLCLIVLWPTIAIGQTKKSQIPSSVFVIETVGGEGLFHSYFEPPYTDGKLEKKISVFVEMKHPKWFLSGNGQFIQDSLSKKGFGFKAQDHLFSMGPIKTEVGLSYSYSKSKERFFQIGTLELIGSTKKHLGIVSIGAGLGAYNKNHFRFSFLASRIYIEHDLDIYVGNQSSNSDNNDFGNDTLGVVGEEIYIYLEPLKIMVFEATGKHLKTRNNKQGIIPSEHLLLESRIIFFVYRNFGISARGTYTDNPHGMAFTSQSVEIGLAVRFKHHHSKQKETLP